MAAPSRPPRPSRATRAARWVAGNWFVLVAAAALAVAGLYLVQWASERGLLPPEARLAMAAAFGAALIGAGERVRRRAGDESGPARHLPSVLSGAGIVTLFAAVLAAVHLFALVGPVAGLVALLLVAALAVALGWFHGPLLIAVGLIGATVAPFATGGSSDDPSLLHAQFVLVAATGLAVDTLRRWGWVSVLAVACGLAGSALLAAGAPVTAPAHAAAVAAVALVSVLLPRGRLRPDHDGPMLWRAARARPRGDTWVAATGVVGASAALALLAEGWPGLLAAAGLAAVHALWTHRARALQDLVAAPLLAFLAIAARPEEGGLLAAFARAIPPEDPAARGATGVLALAAATTLALAWRAARPAPTWPVPWAVAAVALPLAAGLVLDLRWGAPAVLGALPWAWHAVAVAALMVALAGLWARSGDRALPAIAALGVVATLAYAASLVAQEAALTLAFAALAVAAAWMARALRLPLLAWALPVAVPALGWRLLVDPGLVWAVSGPLGPALAATGGTAAALALAAWLLHDAHPVPRLAAESGALLAGAVALSVPLLRALDGVPGTESAIAGLLAAIWGTAALGQAIRAGGGLRRVRLGLAALLALPAAASLALGLTVVSPLVVWVGSTGTAVAGPPLVNSLIPASLAPAAVLWLAHRRLGWRWALWGAWALTAHWAVLAIRHAWRGGGDMALEAGVARGEMLTYTVALLVLGAAVFFRGLATGRAPLRRAGTVLLGLVAAKVFLVDAAALRGLGRVAAFVALGLSLAGLAWLDRRAQGSPDRPSGEAGQGRDP